MSDSNQRRQSPRLWILLSGLVAAASLSVFGQARLPPPGPASRADFCAEAARSPRRPPRNRRRRSCCRPAIAWSWCSSDPDIDTPAVIEFDGNGRMYVAEFVTYMPDVEGTEPARAATAASAAGKTPTATARTTSAPSSPTSSCCRAWCCRSTTTASSPTRPRSDDVIKLTDTNGDGVADKREVFYSGVGIGRDGNLEHEQSGFVWGLDNWIYSTYNSFRFRWTPTGIVREADRLERRPVGAHAGRRRQDVVRVRGLRARAAELPGADPLRRVHESPTSTSRTSTSSGRSPASATCRAAWAACAMPIGVVNHATATGGPDIVRGHRVPAGSRRATCSTPSRSAG